MKVHSNGPLILIAQLLQQKPSEWNMYLAIHLT